MNVISNDAVLQIFEYLNEHDVTRFTRLDKRAAAVVKAHPRLCPKPQINFTIGRKGRCLRKYDFLFHIGTPKAVLNLTKYSLDGPQDYMPKEMVNFLQPFYHWKKTQGNNRTAKKRKDKEETVPEVKAVEEFFNWLFSKFDLSNLSLLSGDVFETLTKKCLQNTRCRCHILDIMFGRLPFKLKPERNLWKPICDRQKNEEVPIKLQLNADNFKELLQHTVQPFVLGEMFSEVITEFSNYPENWNSFNLIMHFMQENWNDGDLTAANFHLLKYRILCPSSDTIDFSGLPTTFFFKHVTNIIDLEMSDEKRIFQLKKERKWKRKIIREKIQVTIAQKKKEATVTIQIIE